jgi:hypothetical protein
MTKPPFTVIETGLKQPGFALEHAMKHCIVNAKYIKKIIK